MPNVLIDAVNEELAKGEVQCNPKVFNIPDMKSSVSWVGKDAMLIKPGDTIPLIWSHEASKKLGKVKSVDFHNGEYLTANIVTTAPNRKWIDELMDYIFEEENRYRTQCLNLPATAIGSDQYLTGRNVFAMCVDEHAASETYKKKTIETILGAIYEDNAFYACKHAFENLKLSFRSAQEKEIAKYSVKDKSELMTPYDIWEQNKKGELPTNTYDIAYNEKKAAAQKEANDIAAKSLKGMYDAYVNAGFTPEQAEKFVTIALEKVAGKI